MELDGPEHTKVLSRSNGGRIKNKSKQLCLETKNTLQVENGSLRFIETLHKQ